MRETVGNLKNWNVMLGEVSCRNEAGGRTLNPPDYLTSKRRLGTRTKEINCHTGRNPHARLGSQLRRVYAADKEDAGLLGCTWRREWACLFCCHLCKIRYRV